jgi:hypothetical protein
VPSRRFRSNRQCRDRFEILQRTQASTKANTSSLDAEPLATIASPIRAESAPGLFSVIEIAKRLQQLQKKPTPPAVKAQSFTPQNINAITDKSHQQALLATKAAFAGKSSASPLDVLAYHQQRARENPVSHLLSRLSGAIDPNTRKKVNDVAALTNALSRAGAHSPASSAAANLKAFLMKNAAAAAAATSAATAHTTTSTSNAAIPLSRAPGKTLTRVYAGNTGVASPSTTAAASATSASGAPPTTPTTPTTPLGARKIPV